MSKSYISLSVALIYDATEKRKSSYFNLFWDYQFAFLFLKLNVKILKIRKKIII